MIYAARRKYFRAAYSQYIRKTFPFLFGRLKSRNDNTIFIINNGMSPSLRRTASMPHLGKSKQNQYKEIDVKLVYSLDHQHSYISNIKVHFLIVTA